MSHNWQSSPLISQIGVRDRSWFSGRDLNNKDSIVGYQCSSVGADDEPVRGCNLLATELDQPSTPSRRNAFHLAASLGQFRTRLEGHILRPVTIHGYRSEALRVYFFPFLCIYYYVNIAPAQLTGGYKLDHITINRSSR